MTAHDDLHLAELAAQTEYDSVLADLTKTTTQLAAATKELVAAQKALADCLGTTPPPPDKFQLVPLGANLQQIAKEAGPGAKLQLPATLKFAGTLTPYPGQHFRGPCAITPANAGSPANYGINAKANDATNTTFENLDVSGFGLRGLIPWFGSLVSGGRYHGNGEMGIGFDGGGADQQECVLNGVETDHNGSTSVLGHGASGVKFFHVRRTKVVNCTTHDNTGNGWWWDAECGEILVQGGECFRNLRKGLFLEKVGAAHASSGFAYDGFSTVDGANLHDNNLEKSQQGNAGIYFVASKNALFKNCTFGGNINAIVVRNDADRLTGQHADHPGWVVSNVEISDTTNKYNSDKVVVGPDVKGVTRT